MPYVKLKDRTEFAPLTAAIADLPAFTPGQLNYLITKLCIAYIDGTTSYGAINDVVGALECAKLEMYRRLAAPYEDRKREENGDVY